MTKPKKIVMHCPCGNAKVLAKGLCSTCYTLKRQDEEYFGGHREDVLKRDDYRCRVPGCTTTKRGKRSVAVHHREAGSSDPAKMLTLCLPCHAKVTRTLYVQDDWPEFLRILWREQHPEGHEQSALNFASPPPRATNVLLFKEMGSRPTAVMAVFETSGVDAPMKEIAGEAGVGVATVYRHFPQRSDLIVAVLAQQIDACANTAKDLAAEYAPDEALSRWMQRYIDLVAKKRGFAGALHSGNPAYAGLAPYFFERMEPALDALLSKASSAGVVQPAVSAEDLLTAVIRLCHGPHGEEPEYARMMVRLLLEGMACHTKEMRKSSANRKS